MTLFAAWSEIVADWAPSFPQPRTFRRATRQALGALVCVGRRCLSRIIWTQGRQHHSWSSEYFLHSRCRWEPQTLFAGVWRRALPYCPGRLVGVAVDDTRLRKTGRAIPQARYHRDPLSPPIHVNLMHGSVFALPHLPGAFTLSPPLPPNRSVGTSPTPGSRPSCSTEASAAV